MIIPLCRERAQPIEGVCRGCGWRCCKLHCQTPYIHRCLHQITYGIMWHMSSHILHCRLFCGQRILRMICYKQYPLVACSQIHAHVYVGVDGFVCANRCVCACVNCTVNVAFTRSMPYSCLWICECVCQLVCVCSTYICIRAGIGNVVFACAWQQVIVCPLDVYADKFVRIWLSIHDHYSMYSMYFYVYIFCVLSPSMLAQTLQWSCTSGAQIA